jgi:hypothetical protein|tara:strand:+ start:817 stop:1014 length:198 start_codon:yes stop_codon:yes gene_type:complete
MHPIITFLKPFGTSKGTLKVKGKTISILLLSTMTQALILRDEQNRQIFYMNFISREYTSLIAINE